MSSGRESVCQCREIGLIPGPGTLHVLSGNQAHTQQLLEPTHSRAHALQLLRALPVQQEAATRVNSAQLWVCLVVQVKSDAVKSNIAQEPGMLGP